MGSLLSGAALGDYLSGLLEALTALGVVAALAFLALRFGALRGALGARGQRLSVEDRLRLDARSQLLIVRVEQRRLLIATHSDGAARLLAELGAPTSEREAESAGGLPSEAQAVAARQPDADRQPGAARPEPRSSASQTASAQPAGGER